MQDNYIIKNIHHGIAHLVMTFELDNNYVDEDDPWKKILAAESFVICSKLHTTNKKSPSQLFFG